MSPLPFDRLACWEDDVLATAHELAAALRRVGIMGIEIEEGSTNVYAYLDRPDAGEMLIKAQLATKIGETIKRQRLTQVEAAEIIGLLQPKRSGLLRGQFRGVSEAKMLNYLTRLGRDVKIVVGPSWRRSGVGHIEGLSG